MTRLLKSALVATALLTSSVALAAISEPVEGTGEGPTASAAIDAAMDSAEDQCAQKAASYEAVSYSVAHGSYSADGPYWDGSGKIPFAVYYASGNSTCYFTFRRR